MPVSAAQVADRATTQSCGGCHQLSSNDYLGGFHTWPAHGISAPESARRTEAGLGNRYSRSLRKLTAACHASNVSPKRPMAGVLRTSQDRI